LTIKIKFDLIFPLIFPLIEDQKQK